MPADAVCSKRPAPPLGGCIPDGGIPNGTEIADSTNRLDPQDDTDGDGLSDAAELNTHHTDPARADTDGGGFPDGIGVTQGTNRLDDAADDATGPTGPTGPTAPTGPADTDGDGLSDSAELKGAKVKQVVYLKGGKRTLKKLISNPVLADSDHDGLTDKQEVTGSKNKSFKRHKTDPLNYDTDGGKVSDGREVKLGSDPSNVKSAPVRKKS